MPKSWVEKVLSELDDEGRARVKEHMAEIEMDELVTKAALWDKVEALQSRNRFVAAAVMNIEYDPSCSGSHRGHCGEGYHHHHDDGCTTLAEAVEAAFEKGAE